MRKPSEVRPGERIGGVTVVAVIAAASHGGKTRLRYRCDCGREKETDGWKTLREPPASCGCQRRNTLRHGYTRPGKVRSEWQAWNHAKQRCYNPKDKDFKDYGGRGIMVCDRWRNSFDAFIADMGDKPSPRHSLDRKEQDGNYEPGNCRWATTAEQSQNRRTVLNLTIGGETLCVAEWSRRTGINRRTIEARVKRGLTGEALLAPVA